MPAYELKTSRASEFMKHVSMNRHKAIDGPFNSFTLLHKNYVIKKKNHFQPIRIKDLECAFHLLTPVWSQLSCNAWGPEDWK